MQISLLLSSGDDGSLLLETARRAEEVGLSALWFPERHLGGAGLFPNPAVAAAAVAVATRRIGLRAGGLALPLHNPIRVAEEWALVDNLSHGRVGIAFGAVNEGDRGEIETVRRLWRGEAARVPDGEGRPIEVRILPQPVQRELPLWLTGVQAAADHGAHLFLEGDGEAISSYHSAGGIGRITVVVPFASSDSGLREVDRLQALGVDEVACRADLVGAIAVIETLAAWLRLLEDRRGG